MVDLSQVLEKVVNSSACDFINTFMEDVRNNVAGVPDDLIKASIRQWVRELILSSLGDLLHERLNRVIKAKSSLDILLDRNFYTLPYFKWLGGYFDGSIIGYIETKDYNNGYRRKLDPKDPLKLNHVEVGIPRFRHSLEDFLDIIKGDILISLVHGLPAPYGSFTCYNVEIVGSLHSVEVRVTGDYRVMEWERDHMKDGVYVQ